MALWSFVTSRRIPAHGEKAFDSVGRDTVAEIPAEPSRLMSHTEDSAVRRQPRRVGSRSLMDRAGGRAKEELDLGLRVALVAACLASLAACGSAGPKRTVSPGSTTSVTTTSTAETSATGSTTLGTTRSTKPSPPTTRGGQVATTRSTITGPATVTVTDAAAAVTVHRGDMLRVVLGSTYWVFQTPSNPAVLSPEGAPVVAASMPCVPGGGCGTATAVYLSQGAGSSTVVATRTSCGEAMGCTGSRGRYTLTVTVI